MAFVNGSSGVDWTVDKANNLVTMGKDGLHMNRGKLRGFGKPTPSLLKATFPKDYPTEAERKQFDGSPIFVSTSDPGHTLPFLLSSVAYTTFAPANVTDPPAMSITHQRSREWLAMPKKERTITKLWSKFPLSRVCCATLCDV